jgi:hypothetical protein
MMKKFTIIFFAILVLTELMPAWAGDGYDQKIIPEAIWAPAAEWGTWQTELSILSFSDDAWINAMFFYGGSQYRIINLIPDVGVLEMVTIPNVLEYMQSLDDGFQYYGRIGTLVVYDANGGLIDVNVRIWHSGRCSKSYAAYPEGVGCLSGYLQYGYILSLSQTEEKRSSVVFYNSAVPPAVLQCTIMSPEGEALGVFEKYIGTNGVEAFNPFAEAGLPGDYENCYLMICNSGWNVTVYAVGSVVDTATSDPSFRRLLIN